MTSNECDVTAAELDETAIPLLRTRCNAVVNCDLNDPLWPEQFPPSERFDAVIALDVLAGC